MKSWVGTIFFFFFLKGIDIFKFEGDKYEKRNGMYGPINSFCALGIGNGVILLEYVFILYVVEYNLCVSMICDDR